jgi:hypothetical protein
MAPSGSRGQGTGNRNQEAKWQKSFRRDYRMKRIRTVQNELCSTVRILFIL